MTYAKSNFNNTLYLLTLLIAVSIQGRWNKKIKPVKIYGDVVALPPEPEMIKLFSWGDKEFYYRIKAFQLQNFGDTFGRLTPLKNYDHNRLQDWFKTLEQLNYTSNYIPSMAAYYFSRTPIKKDKQKVVNFLSQHALRDMKNKWWWLYQAIYIANFELKAKTLAINLAHKLYQLAPPNAPLWTKKMVVILLRNNGAYMEAARIGEEILADLQKSDRTPTPEKIQELEYMKLFLEKKREDLKSASVTTSPQKCSEE